MYRVLAEPLQPTAEAAISYFKNHHGAKAVSIEEEIDPVIQFRPTFHGMLPDKHLLCAEVSEVPMPPGIHDFILQARNESLPARFWVVLPKGVVRSVDTAVLKFFKDNGVGLLEIDAASANILVSPPLSMSLTGLRQFKVTEFPAKYRDDIRRGIETFRNGNPAKACADIYDIIEAITRRILAKAIKVQPGLTCKLDPEKDSWAAVLEFLRNRLDRKSLNCPQLTVQLFNRLIGMTEFRNESGHKPRTLDQLRNRDRQLRTRFEAACDELHAVIKASGPLRI